MSQPDYDSDLIDEEWQQIESLLPPEKPVGKEREVELRVVQWRNFLPRGQWD